MFMLLFHIIMLQNDSSDFILDIWDKHLLRSYLVILKLHPVSKMSNSQKNQTKWLCYKTEQPWTNLRKRWICLITQNKKNCSMPMIKNFLDRTFNYRILRPLSPSLPVSIWAAKLSDWWDTVSVSSTSPVAQSDAVAAVTAVWQEFSSLIFRAAWIETVRLAVARWCSRLSSFWWNQSSTFFFLFAEYSMFAENV